MSDSKKIRNRLNQIFRDINEPEGEQEQPKAAKKTSRKQPAKQPVASASPKKKMAEPNTSTLTSIITDTDEQFSTLSVPFNVGENDWNNIEVIDEKSRDWNPQEQALVRDVVDQLTLALQNAKLFQQTQKQNSNLEILNEMGRELATQLDVTQVIEYAFKYTSQLLDTQSFFIALLNNDTNTLSFPVVTVGGKRIEFPDRKSKPGAASSANRICNNIHARACARQKQLEEFNADADQES